MNNNETKVYWYPKNNDDADIVIRHYMRLDYLLKLLETKMFYVKRRAKFDGDANESYYDHRFEFSLSIVSSGAPPQPKPKTRMMSFGKIVECPTSCWNKSDHENFLMWKCYATEIGACIKTSVKHLVGSLQVDLAPDGDNKIICGAMNYVEHPHSNNELGQLFNKYYGYSAEDEFRFYFDLKSGIVIQTDNILVPVDTKDMINEITLSPFIAKEASDKIASMIKYSYGIENVEQSKIKLK